MIASAAFGHRATIALALVASGLTSQAQADTLADSGGWTYEIAPYLWGAGQRGEIAVDDRLAPAEVDLSFSDILEDLSMGAMVFGSATKGSYGIFGDLQYITTEADIEHESGIISGSSETSTFVATVGGEYIAYASAQSEVRLMAGVRHWAVGADIDLELPAGDRSADGDNSWTDGVLGLRARHQISTNGTLTGSALVGSGGSNSMVDVFVGYNHALTETTSLVGGYRYLSVDRDDGDFEYDIEQDGFLLGVRFVFN